MNAMNIVLVLFLSQQAASVSAPNDADVRKRSVAVELAAREDGEHPLGPVLRWARGAAERIERMPCYSATLIRRERIDGKLGERQHLFMKIRHEPFSVYMRILKPESIAGTECIYVEGKNGGRMRAHPKNPPGALFGTDSLRPDGVIAMQGQRYPVTELDILNLTRRIVEFAEKDVKLVECEVAIKRGKKIDKRTCTCVEITHPVPRKDFRFHIARICVDDERNIPVLYQAFDWPKEEGAEPELIEEYKYVDVKLGQRFTDADFDVNNPKYDFPYKPYKNEQPPRGGKKGDCKRRTR